MSDDNKKLVNLSGLKTVAKGLDQKATEKVQNAFTSLNTTINGKADKNHTHDEYCSVDRIVQSENDIENLEQQITEFNTTISAIPNTVKETVLNDLLGGKRHVYLLGDAYDALTEAEKSDDTVVYNIIDAESTEHEHENLEILNSIQPVTFKIGNAITSLDYRNAVEISLEDMGASKSDHIHDDMYYTESEIDTKFETFSSEYNSDYAEMLSKINGKAEEGHTHSMADISETFADISPVNGKLTLTDARIQYASDVVSYTEIDFPTVVSYTELHVFFESTENLNLVFPENCKWRIDANIETGSAYELIAKYIPNVGTGTWLVNILVYS
jgi:hypothetical protein